MGVRKSTTEPRPATVKTGAVALRGPALPGPASTPGRIIEAAVQLFNTDGVHNVPMHRIAAEIGISPGNLAYHFRSKRDLLFAILPQLESQLRAALPVPREPLSPAGAAEYQVNLFRTLWRYRFFFNALTYLLSRDPELRQQYMTFQRHVLDSLQSLLDTLVESSAMRAVTPPNTTQLLAMNMWMLWLSWLRFEQINNPGNDVAEDAAIYDGALQHFSLLHTYYGKQFGIDLLQELQKLRKKGRGVTADPPAAPYEGLRPGSRRNV